MRAFVDDEEGITADDATSTAHAVASLHESNLRMTSEPGLGSYGPALVDLFAEHPIVTVVFVTDRLGASPTTACQMLARAVDARMIGEITGKKRNRIFRHSQLLDLFTTDAPLNSPTTPGAST